MFRLSQTQLNLLTTCPRKFQHTYLEQLATPISPEHQEKLAWGSRFHLLMQQRELGLPIESIVKEDPEMAHCLTTFMNASPELFAPLNNNTQIFRQAEHARTLTFQNYLLTVIYDLLIAEPKQAQIFDWKTYPLPQNSQWLAQHWQTRLYRYVLVETSHYLPEQVSMTYWFVQSHEGNVPKSLKFPYDRTQHQQTEADLTNLLNQLTAWLKNYQKKGEPFPLKANINSGHCDTCQFTTRCHFNDQIEGVSLVQLEANNSSNFVSDLATIEEVSI